MSNGHKNWIAHMKEDIMSILILSEPTLNSNHSLHN